ncbi:MAG: hypothetical protein PVF74_08640 [Anaerolineales bacterium]
MLSKCLRTDLLVQFLDCLLPIDIQTMITWGQLVAWMEARGTPIPLIRFSLSSDRGRDGFHAGHPRCEWLRKRRHSFTKPLELHQLTAYRNLTSLAIFVVFSQLPNFEVTFL